MTQSIMLRFQVVLFIAFMGLAASCSSTPPSDTNGVLPAQIGGTSLEIQTFDGSQIVDSKSAAWAKALSQIGASVSDLSLAVSVPQLDAASDFQIGALRIAGTDWAPRLDVFVQNANAAGNVTFTQVELGGKTVYRGVNKASPDKARAYYLVAGDTLFFIVASNESEVSEALTKIPGVSTNSSLKSSSLDPKIHKLTLKPQDLPPPTGVLLVNTIVSPVNPLCVGELPSPLQRFILIVADGNMIPDVMASTFPRTPYGKAYPPVMIGSLPTFIYNATSWAAGNGQQLIIDVVSPIYGDKTTHFISPPQIIVMQCLSGSNWKDGDRGVSLTQKGATFSGGQTSGSATCVSPGYSLSGSFSGGAVAQITGSDLLVCNPPACVSAGFLSKTDTATFSGTLSDDGKTLSITWQDGFHTLKYDDEGTLVSCNQTSLVQSSFVLTRAFAEPWQN